MNIFFTSTCPDECAKNLDDKRLVKMVLETAQLLCTTINECGGKAPYKTTHKNHPSAVWARASRSNFKWLHGHFRALCKEYTNRYNKTHKCEQYIDEIYYGRKYVPTGPLTPFANCAAHQGKGFNFKAIEPVTEAYKQYLNARWATDTRTPKWTNREEPTWSNLNTI